MKNKDQLRVGVIGMGPIGTTLTAHLIEAGAYVVPCDIDRARIDKIKTGGIRLENVIEKETPVSETCYAIEELEKHDLDLVAIAVKTPSLAKVVSLLHEIASDRMFVMSTQNGLDNEQDVARIFGPDRTLRMVINYAGGMKDHNTVHLIFFNPPNYIAPLTSGGKEMAEKIAAVSYTHLTLPTN